MSVLPMHILFDTCFHQSQIITLRAPRPLLSRTVRPSKARSVWRSFPSQILGRNNPARLIFGAILACGVPGLWLCDRPATPCAFLLQAWTRLLDKQYGHNLRA